MSPNPSSPSRRDWSSSSLASPGALISRIESLLEPMVHALSRGEPMSIELLSHRSLRQLDGQARRRLISFPGNSLAEAQKFSTRPTSLHLGLHAPYKTSHILARVLFILQLSHDALVSGDVLTKRPVSTCSLYQHLFDKQRVVDDLVDDIAVTLDTHRDSLNIVASAKGLLSGRLIIQLRDGSTIDASSGDAATFRSLVSSRYWETSAAGPGLLITVFFFFQSACYSNQLTNLKAKGYPDLVTRSFLHRLHERHTQVPILVVTDLDHDGLNIFRCYRFGADGDHNLGIHWLGINTRHVQEVAAKMPASKLHQRSESLKTSISSTECRDGISLLSTRDRRMAVHMLARIAVRCPEGDAEAENLKLETQTMLMMNVKAEMQWLDDAGDMTKWLDDELPTLEQTHLNFHAPQRPYPASCFLSSACLSISNPSLPSNHIRSMVSPQLTDDEIDDIMYFSRAGETDELHETLSALAQREKVSPAEILEAVKDDAGSTPLHMATGNGHLETTRSIINLVNSSPSKQTFLDHGNEHGNTSLHWAALGGHLAIVELLLSNGASAACVNEGGCLAFDMALRNDRQQVVDFFLADDATTGIEALALEEMKQKKKASESSD
ncbi:hypothetical protein L249_3758 [Ophiocordyceps polyrhachis-furcata BCC 54312]|uniref:DNA topoisomerase (ATP-hydrolyzing) n=1 Tax=Ophiocordyceps polyrhachis-furcata BCC 54312 TaxID=1330021 RepID=A0A367L4R9_9HYPO|nr:hypothetical protein L249_3758 [Ophiocordyceps polyrhachis-furcata BCC 54312]